MIPSRQISGARWLIAVPAPILYAITFLLGIGLGRAFPLPAGSWPAGTRIPGGFFIASGILLAPCSAALFGFRRTTLNPVGSPAALVTDGAYRFTRNPMYAGVTLAYLGLALLLERMWPIVLLPIPVVLMNYLVIPYEEARMRAAFGPRYTDYCRRVRRWI